MQNQNFEQLSPNGTVITPSTRLKYLSPAMDNRLGFETQIAHKVSSAKQRLQLVISTNLCERDIVSRNILNIDLHAIQYNCYPILFLSNI